MSVQRQAADYIVLV